MTQASSENEEAENQPPEAEGSGNEDRGAASQSSGLRLLARNCRSWLAGFLRLRADKSSWRIRLVAAGFAMLYLAIGVRLAYLGSETEPPQALKSTASDIVSEARPDVLDRNGEILATDVKVVSVFAEPRRIIDVDDAVDLLRGVLPDLDAQELHERLSSHKGFVWIKRDISPKEQDAIFHLGLPGIGFLPENRRVYPNGPIAAHVLGFTDVDNKGIAGIEKYIDGQGLAALNGFGFRMLPDDLKPITLSIDLDVTHAVRDELAKGIEKFKAKSGAAAIMDVNTGEVIALASLPDFDPNHPVDARDPDRINRLTVGVYEMGSTFKALTLAMALDAGKVTLNSRVDARESLRYGHFTIHDFHAQHRMLTVPEVFTYSSNIGAARMALMVGVDGHKAFLTKMGQLDRMRTELPESAAPLVPQNWGELNTMTIAFGQGLNVAPLQAMMAVAALVNGGMLIRPTFLKRSPDDAMKGAVSVVKPETSEALRYLMRLNAEVGSAKAADIKGYFVGGKTGTADKIVHGRYSNDRVFTTFMAIMPADKPQYLFLTLMDEPQGIPETHGYRTAAWNSGEVTGKIITRVGPLLGLPPRPDPTLPFPLLAKAGYTAANVPAKGSTEH
jgi:cell division protein FtsI (penicillin-binding protein 3)